MIENESDLAAKTIAASSNLHLAAEYGNIDLIRKLIEEDAFDPNIFDKNNGTPLHFAAGNSQLSSIKLLLELGADISIQDKVGNSTLQYAIRCKREPEFIEELIKLTDESIFRSTFEFILINKMDKILKIIDQKGAGAHNIENLHEAVKVVLEKALWQKKYPSNREYNKVFEFLLKSKLTFPILEEQNFGLDICAKIGMVDYLPQMLEHNVNLNCVYKDGATALNISIASRNREFAEYLIDSGADVDIADVDGVTPAHLASLLGMFTILATLIDKFPGLLTCVDNNGDTALDYARFGGHKKCITLLEKALGVFQNPEEAEIKVGDVADIEFQEECVVTKQEEDQYSFVQKQIHKYYQLQKLGVNQLDNDTIIESWVMGEEVFSTASERILEVRNDYGNKVYFAISAKVSSVIDAKYGAVILEKFNSAILNGFVGKYGKAGVKDIDHNLYELKILSSICGNLRAYTTTEYLNSNGAKLIVFNKIGNHHNVSRALRESNGITQEAVSVLPNIGLESVLIKAVDINPHDIFKQCLQSCIDNSDIFSPNDDRAILDLIGSYILPDAD